MGCLQPLPHAYSLWQQTGMAEGHPLPPPVNTPTNYTLTYNPVRSMSQMQAHHIELRAIVHQTMTTRQQMCTQRGALCGYITHCSPYQLLHGAGKCCSHAKSPIVQDVHCNFEPISLLCVQTDMNSMHTAMLKTSCYSEQRKSHRLLFECSGLEATI